MRFDTIFDSLVLHQQHIKRLLKPSCRKVCFGDQLHVTENKDLLQSRSTQNASLAVLLTA